jgi:hypothetical protein
MAQQNSMDTLKSFENISNIVVRKWHWVLDAIVQKARAAKVSFTKKELGDLANKLCVQIDTESNRKDCLVHPGQVIDLNTPEKQQNVWTTETLTGFAWLNGFVKYTDPSGKVTYTLNGKEIPKAQKRA